MKIVLFLLKSFKLIQSLYKLGQPIIIVVLLIICHNEKNNPTNNTYNQTEDSL